LVLSTSASFSMVMSEQMIRFRDGLRGGGVPPALAASLATSQLACSSS
jgi:hypothetical protein